MNRRRRPYALLLQLAFLATLLMALAPLLSRWQQAHGDPVMLLPGGMAHVMPRQAPDHATPPMHDHTSMHHGALHAMPEHAHHTMPAEPAPQQSPLDPHAGHGEACEYCMMASRLMPWLAVILVLLPALPKIAPHILRSVTPPRSLRWPAHAARGPPLHAAG